jgi:L-gulonolactone oxidase
MVVSTGWRNWAGNQHADAAEVRSPADAGEVAEAVLAARAGGRRVRAVGSGHSFTAAAVTDGVRLELGRLAGVRVVDGHDVTVGAGTTLHDLGPLLAGRGLAMTNLGDIDAQTVSGAVSTGTHGTGVRFPGLAGQVSGLELVLADGAVVTCSAAERPELFAAARLGLGSVGVITAMTLRCEPAYLVRAEETPGRLPDLLADLPGFFEGADHAEFFWFPHTDRTLIKQNSRLPADSRPEPVGRFRGWLDDEFLSNSVFGALCRVGRAAPRTVPAINQVSARALGARTFTDISYRVFATSRRVRFLEMEYALPLEAVAAALRDVEALIERLGLRVSFPIEVRCAPADDIWLSTAYGRATGYVAVHAFVGTPYERYFDEVERVMVAAGGRPHWGKLHTRTAADLAACYPRWDDFQAVRAEVDPAGVFGNGYLDQVLGPVTGATES